MTLYIPVETLVRELDGKLLLALHAVQHGHKVVLGNRSLMSNLMHRFEPGIFLTHNFNKGRRRILQIIRQLGHHIVAMDEEGLVWLNPENYLHRRVDAQSLECIDTVYAWGPEQAEALGPLAKNCRVEVIATGNPRADLLRPPLRDMYRQRGDQLVEKYGKFILINSNFGLLNFALKDSDGNGEKTPEELRERARETHFPEGFFTFRYAMFQAFLDVLPDLSARFPDQTIVIRPHPSENPAVWLKASENLTNVKVLFDDELVPWLLAADAIIHNGCTTAIEAKLLGRPAISYCPVDGGEFEISQPARVSIAAKDPESLFAAIASPGDVSDETDVKMAHIISGLGEQTAAAHIAALISTIGLPKTSTPLTRLAGKAASLWRSVERYGRGLSKSSLASRAYVDHKFPPTPVADIEGRLSTMAKLLDLPMPKVSEYSDRIYVIEPAE